MPDPCGAPRCELSFVEVIDAVTDAVPERTMVICGDVRRSFSEVRRRSRNLARYLLDQGVGCYTERADLHRWAVGQDTVALVLHNCAEYLEAMYGAFRARAIPFNVNQHYRAREIESLLEDVGPSVVIYHLAYGALVAAAIQGRSVVLVHVDDGSGLAPLEGSVAYEFAIEAGEASRTQLPRTDSDDVYMVCTGGTTGRPKAVLWRQADAYVTAMAGSDDATAESIAAGARNWSGGPWYAVPPLMHAAAQWTAFSGLHLGAPVLLHDDSEPFDAHEVLWLVEAEGAFLMSIVGDAYAVPMVEVLDDGEFDLSSLVVLATGGAATSEHLKEALLSHLPNAVIRDGYGASETGGMAFGSRSGPDGTSGRARVGFAPGSGATVVSEDRSRFLEPGDDELGWIVRRGRVPLGYLNDEERTSVTFPTVGDERVAIPGDRGRLLDDGTIELVGRDSMVVNTGGEKVFVEEVEQVLRAHRDIRDALVVGRPSTRFGSEVVALVATEPGTSMSPEQVRAVVSSELAGFKAPRAVLCCAAVRRLANGKGDYHWAAQAALDAHDATGGR